MKKCFLAIAIFITMPPISKGAIYEPVSMRLEKTNLRFCWWGEDSPYTRDLRIELQVFLTKNVLDLTPFSDETNRYNGEENWPSCESIDPNEVTSWVNLLIFDDPIWGEDPLSHPTLRKFNFEENHVRDRSAPGHPTTLSKGKKHAQEKFDILISSGFNFVKPRLREQAEKFNDLGKLNLIKSIFAHEFLHFVGAKHEHLHPDAHCDLGDLSFDEDDMKYYEFVTEYDSSSIMNRCNTYNHDYDGSPLLPSQLDLKAINLLYD